MEAVLKDERFARVATERKFRSVGRKQRKVQIDQRFQAMFSEPRFVSRCSVDKRGRPTSFSSKENFKKYYDLKDSDESDSDDDNEEVEEKRPKLKSDRGAKKGKKSKLLSKADKEKEAEETSSDESIETRVKVIVILLPVPYQVPVTLLSATIFRKNSLMFSV
jgi:hypothetical protein